MVRFLLLVSFMAIFLAGATGGSLLAGQTSSAEPTNSYKQPDSTPLSGLARALQYAPTVGSKERDATSKKKGTLKSSKHASKAKKLSKSKAGTSKKATYKKTKSAKRATLGKMKSAKKSSFKKRSKAKKSVSGNKRT